MSKKVTIVGSGNWGSAIAKIVGKNVADMKGFDPKVTMYVYEELIDGKKLTEIINTTHENVKYLPNIILPSNVFAEPDLEKACKDADFLIFVVPHQFIHRICATLKNKIKPTAVGVSLIKGFVENPGGGIKLISHLIKEELNIDVAVLMGANIANEVAKEEFCETTIGCKDLFIGKILKQIMETDNFRVTVVSDTDTVEICGALKNIVACAAGFADGLGLGDNTKAAVIRLGLMEMIEFVELFYGGGALGTFFESCGVADLITTCYGGRNRRCSELFVKVGKPLKQIEEEYLNGQKLQGPLAAEEVIFMLEGKNATEKFPLFHAVQQIFQKKMEPKDLIKVLRNHPIHNDIVPSMGKPEIEHEGFTKIWLRLKKEVGTKVDRVRISCSVGGPFLSLKYSSILTEFLQLRLNKNEIELVK